VSQELYIPREVDVRWARTVTSVVRDSGAVGIPMVAAVYHVNKREKQFERIFRGFEDDWNHNRQKCVFGLIGWTVVDKSRKEVHVPES
jgi:hypothetical protein